MDKGEILKILSTGFFLVVLAFCLSCSPQSTQAEFERPSEKSRTNPGFNIPIIPGGIGFGMETPAGSGPDREGGAIIHVTTLAEDGPGSLREALNTKGPRIVVFDVSGNIKLRSEIDIDEPYLAIAGQTAPSPGIALVGAGIAITTHDVLVQHIRIRVGDNRNGPDPQSRDVLTINDWPDEENDVYNAVIDHVSVSWAIYENMSTWGRVHDITITNSILSEALWHSIHPHAYIQSNVIGTLNILEGCRHNNVEHLVYASTSSVYGLNAKYPFSVSDSVNHPVSLYGATKKDNELMAHSYAHLYKLPVTGLRFFTVYGPWGRPDMALFIFTKNILEGKPIDVFNRGDMVRDFTYIDDIVEGVVRVVMKIPESNSNWEGTKPDPASSPAPYRVYNIGSNSPVKLMDFIQEIEKNLGKKAQLNLMPFQLGDFHKSHADVSSLIEDFGYTPKFNVQIGVKNFVDWYTSYFGGKTKPQQKNS